MLVLRQTPPASTPTSSTKHNPSTTTTTLLSVTSHHHNNKYKSTTLFSQKRYYPKHSLTVPKAADSSNSTPRPTQQQQQETVFVGPSSDVPLEGVIQFDKQQQPSSLSRFDKWGRIGLLAGGDVLALLLFAAIGRFSHGFPVFDPETLRTADPFIAGWFLSAYFLGGFSEDGRGMNGLSKALFATARSWALGIPLGVGIRTLTSAHFPPTAFILVTLGSTAVLLIGCRALLFQILPNQTKKDDLYKRGSPFELFELLTSLVRRW